MTISSTNWSEKYVDDQINKAWFEFKLGLANYLDQSPTSPVRRFEIEKTDESEENLIRLADHVLIDFIAPDGRTVTVAVHDPMIDQGKIRIEADGEPNPILTRNVDEAAHLVVEILVGTWQVPHPSFLTSENHPELLPKPIGEEAAKLAPEIGHSESPQLINAWITSAVREVPGVKMDDPSDDRLKGHGASEIRFEITQSSVGFIEIATLVLEDIGALDFREWANQAETVKLPVTFFLKEKALWMKTVQFVVPFVKDHIQNMVFLQINLVPMVVRRIQEFNDQESENSSTEAESASIENLGKRVVELEGRLEELRRGDAEPEVDPDDGEAA